MRKAIFFILVGLLTVITARAQISSGFNGYGDVLTTNTIASDTFEVTTTFIGAFYSGDQYIVDSMAIGDWFFLDCYEYRVVSITSATAGLATFRIKDVDSGGGPWPGARFALFRKTPGRGLIRPTMGAGFGITENEYNCIIQHLINQLDTVATEDRITYFVPDDNVVISANSGDTIAVSGAPGLYTYAQGEDIIIQNSWGEFNVGSAADSLYYVAIYNGVNTYKRIQLTDLPGLIATGEANTASNLGDGSQVFKQKSGVDFEFRTLKQGGIITLNQTDTTIVITGTEVDGSITNEGLLNVLPATDSTSIIESNTSGSPDIVLLEGPYVELTENGDTITISVAGVGTIQGAVNLGVGDTIYTSVSGTDLQFKSLDELFGINLVTNDTTILFEVDTAQIVTVWALADSLSSFSATDTSGSNYTLTFVTDTLRITDQNGSLEVILDTLNQTVSAGYGINVTPSGEDFAVEVDTAEISTVWALGDSLSNYTPGAHTIDTHIGNQDKVLTGTRSLDLDGNSLTINDATTQVTLELNPGGNYAQMIGGTLNSVYLDANGIDLNVNINDTLRFDTIRTAEGPYFVVIADDGAVTKMDTTGWGGGGTITGATNLGTGDTIFTTVAGGLIQLKSLTAGSNITLTPSANSIEISATGGGGGTPGPVEYFTYSINDTDPDTISITSGVDSISHGGTLTLNSTSFSEIGSTGRILYSGASTAFVLLDVSTSFSFSAGGQTVEAWVYKNGTVLDDTEMHRKIGTGGDVGNGGLVGLVSISNGDTLDLRYTANFNGTLIIQNSNFRGVIVGSEVGEANVAVNLGTGDTIYVGKTDTTLQFKSFTEGFGVNYITSATEIQIETDTTQLATVWSLGDSLSNYSLTDTSGSNYAFVITNDTLNLTDQNGTLFVELAPYLDNTDAQTLSLSGDTLSISGGNFVELDTLNQSVSEGYGINVTQTNEDFEVEADTTELSTPYAVIDSITNNTYWRSDGTNLSNVPHDQVFIYKSDSTSYFNWDYDAGAGFSSQSIFNEGGWLFDVSNGVSSVLDVDWGATGLMAVYRSDGTDYTYHQTDYDFILLQAADGGGTNRSSSLYVEDYQINMFVSEPGVNDPYITLDESSLFLKADSIELQVIDYITIDTLQIKDGARVVMYDPISKQLGSVDTTGLFTDTNTEYTAGYGLDLAGTVFSADTTEISTVWALGDSLSNYPSGSGITNYVARWTPDANTLGTGIIQDNGSQVGIGIAPSTVTFRLSGDAILDGGSDSNPIDFLTTYLGTASWDFHNDNTTAGTQSQLRIGNASGTGSRLTIGYYYNGSPSDAGSYGYIGTNIPAINIAEVDAAVTITNELFASNLDNSGGTGDSILVWDAATDEVLLADPATLQASPQTLSLAGDTLSISGGNFVELDTLNQSVSNGFGITVNQTGEDFEVGADTSLIATVWSLGDSLSNVIEESTVVEDLVNGLDIILSNDTIRVYHDMIELSNIATVANGDSLYIWDQSADSLKRVAYSELVKWLGTELPAGDVSINAQASNYFQLYWGGFADEWYVDELSNYWYSTENGNLLNFGLTTYASDNHRLQLTIDNGADVGYSFIDLNADDGTTPDIYSSWKQGDSNTDTSMINMFFITSDYIGENDVWSLARGNSITNLDSDGFEFIRVKMHNNTSNNISFYDKQYFWKNGAPSVTNNDTSFHVWIGNGSGTTPAFIELADVLASASVTTYWTATGDDITNNNAGIVEVDSSLLVQRIYFKQDANKDSTTYKAWFEERQADNVTDIAAYMDPQQLDRVSFMVAPSMSDTTYDSYISAFNYDPNGSTTTYSGWAGLVLYREGDLRITNTATGNGDIWFSTGNTERMRIDSTTGDITFQNDLFAPNLTQTTQTYILGYNTGTGAITAIDTTGYFPSGGGGGGYWSLNGTDIYNNNTEKVFINFSTPDSTFTNANTAPLVVRVTEADTFDLGMRIASNKAAITGLRIDNANSGAGASGRVSIYNDQGNYLILANESSGHNGTVYTNFPQSRNGSVLIANDAVADTTGYSNMYFTTYDNASDVTESQMYFGTGNLFAMVIDSSQRIGINTISPDSVLTVSGSAKIQSTLLLYPATGDGVNIKAEDQASTGRLSIQAAGTDEPIYAFFLPNGTSQIAEFQVSNSSDPDARGRMNIGVNATTATLGVDVTPAGGDSITVFNIGEVETTGVNKGLTDINFLFGNSTLFNMEVDAAGGSNGEFGINTANPTANLHVSGGTAIIDSTLTANDSVYFTGIPAASQVNILGYNSTTGVITYIDTTGYFPSGGGADTNFGKNDITFTGNRTHALSSNSLTVTDAGTGMTLGLVPSTGDVTLGATSSDKFSISSTEITADWNGSSIFYGDDTQTYTAFGSNSLAANSSQITLTAPLTEVDSSFIAQRIYLKENGNKDSTALKFWIQERPSSSQNRAIFYGEPDAGNRWYTVVAPSAADTTYDSGFELWNTDYDNGGGSISTASYSLIRVDKDGTLKIANQNDDIIFLTGLTERMRIDSTTGYVGIGTSGTPLHTLDVIGDARITGGFYDSDNQLGTTAQLLGANASGELDWLNQSALSITESQISDLSHTVDTHMANQQKAIDGSYQHTINSGTSSLWSIEGTTNNVLFEINTSGNSIRTAAGTGYPSGIIVDGDDGITMNVALADALIIDTLPTSTPPYFLGINASNQVYKVDTTGWGGGGSGIIDSTTVTNSVNGLDIFETANDITIAHNMMELTALAATAESTDSLYIWDSSTDALKRIAVGNLPGGGGGETNTASNVGNGDTIFYQKSGVDLQFKSFLGTGITFTSTDTTLTIVNSATPASGIIDITSASTSIPAANLNSRYVGIVQIDMTSGSTASNITFNAPTNPVTAGTYTFHFQNTQSPNQDIVFPSSMNDAQGADLGTVTYSNDDFITCYYDGTDYFCK